MAFRLVKENWIDVGSASTLNKQPLQQVMLGTTRVALVYKDGRFSALSGACNYVGGPLGEGRMDTDYVVCPWHYWKFHAGPAKASPASKRTRCPRTT